jgi:circadian clock protein KaiB
MLPTNERLVEQVVLRLYIAGQGPNSLRAIANLRAICGDQENGLARLEIIDVLENPLLALSDGVMVTPTLMRLSPPPVRVIVGDLSKSESVRQLLQIGKIPS